MFADLVARLAGPGINKGISIGVALSSPAINLALALFAFFVVMRGLKAAASTNDSIGQFFADLVEKLVVLAIIFWLIDPRVGLYATFIRDWIWTPMMNMVSIAQGVSYDASANPLRALEDSLTIFTDATIKAILNPQTDGLSLRDLSLIGFLSVFLKFVGVGLAIVITWLAKAVIIASYCTGIVMFAVGAAVGPLFIAMLVNDRLDNYFWSWLRFMIVSSLTLLVAVVIVMVMAGAVAGFADPGSGQIAGNIQMLNSDASVAGTWAAVGPVILLAVFMAYLVSQAPEIANALFSGNPSGIRSGASRVVGDAKSAAKASMSTGKAAVKGGKTVATGTAALAGAAHKAALKTEAGKNASAKISGMMSGARDQAAGTLRAVKQAMGFAPKGAADTAKTMSSTAKAGGVVGSAAAAAAATGVGASAASAMAGGASMTEPFRRVPLPEGMTHSEWSNLPVVSSDTPIDTRESHGASATSASAREPFRPVSARDLDRKMAAMAKAEAASQKKAGSPFAPAPSSSEYSAPGERRKPSPPGERQIPPQQPDAPPPTSGDKDV